MPDVELGSTGDTFTTTSTVIGPRSAIIRGIRWLGPRILSNYLGRRQLSVYLGRKSVLGEYA